MASDIQHLPTYTVARPAGAVSLGRFMSFLQLLAIDSRDWPKPLLLLDLTDLDSMVPFTEQLIAGAEVGRALAGLRKVACLVSDSAAPRLNELAPRRAGLDLRVFASEREALAWLQS